jgi:hypothetical protein
MNMMMRLFCALLLLLAVPSDASLRGMINRFLQGPQEVVDLCHPSYMFGQQWLNSTEVANLTTFCEEDRDEEKEFQCETIDIVDPAIYSIQCNASSECPPWPDGTKRICIFANFGTHPGTACHKQETFEPFRQSVYEIKTECPPSDDITGGRR